ncbi:thymidylate synthase [Sporothrix schenckii ATCC 58251]|uniref:thymidylate synthase n=1 Tax=Sporothrix schenckii (strain ATCC 58251 / de Perez 2211183) TaxID=1391915 RepID=U7PSY6_SPOS1|nr:thymidylate synthase [Sporothrix schenckii ATCC 58251]
MPAARDDTAAVEPAPAPVAAKNGTEAQTQTQQTETQPTEAPPAEGNKEEDQYLDLVREILETGEHRPDRTGTGTYSLFAPRPLKFALHRRDAASGDVVPVLPLLTTKRVFTRAVIEELLWFVRGETTSTTLAAKGVKIWDGNGSRAFLDQMGFTDREDGDLGPVYGFQWRHFGAAYQDPHTDYAGQGVDQLAEVVRKLKETPFDRRILLSAWNPRDLPQMVLPPCHMFAQFYVSYPDAPRRRTTSTTAAATAHPPPPSAPSTASTASVGHLHCQLYQRSCDMGLGVPFNIASYALLTHMLARVCGLVPGSLTHVMGDAHVYVDHVDALETQLARVPRAFPTLTIRNDGSSIDGWQLEDFVIEGYNPYKAIAMKMSV